MITKENMQADFMLDQQNEPFFHHVPMISRCIFYFAESLHVLEAQDICNYGKVYGGGPTATYWFTLVVPYSLQHQVHSGGSKLKIKSTPVVLPVVTGSNGEV
jgi:hypothetical protein